MNTGATRSSGLHIDAAFIAIKRAHPPYSKTERLLSFAVWQLPADMIVEDQKNQTTNPA